LERLKEFVAGLDKKRDDKLLEHVRSKKSVILKEMSKELEASTITVC
jgi:DeoR/GlpR family transcriptional regulator of sugar metabolism